MKREGIKKGVEITKEEEIKKDEEAQSQIPNIKKKYYRIILNMIII